MSDASHTQTKVAPGLHICLECGSGLVQPTCWEQTADRGHWRLWRRCPECEWSCDAVHSEREIEAYDEELDRGTETLSGDLKALEREGMERMAESFATALSGDLITAEDFR